VPCIVSLLVLLFLEIAENKNCLDSSIRDKDKNFLAISFIPLMKMSNFSVRKPIYCLKYWHLQFFATPLL